MTPARVLPVLLLVALAVTAVGLAVSGWGGDLAAHLLGAGLGLGILLATALVQHRATGSVATALVAQVGALIARLGLAALAIVLCQSFLPAIAEGRIFPAMLAVVLAIGVVLDAFVLATRRQLHHPPPRQQEALRA